MLIFGQVLELEEASFSLRVLKYLIPLHKFSNGIVSRRGLTCTVDLFTRWYDRCDFRGKKQKISYQIIIVEHTVIKGHNWKEKDEKGKCV